MTDPSAASQALGFVTFVAVVVLAAVLGRAVTLTVRRRNARRALRTPSTEARRVTTKCDVTNCHAVATVLVLERADLGGELRLVCPGCSQYGEHADVNWWEVVGTVAA